MRRLLNTLYVTNPNAYLARDGETVHVRVEQVTKLKAPIHTLSGIVCFGHILCSPSCMELCARNGVTLSFLTEHGRFMARVHGPVSGNVLLRRAQYRAAEDPDRRADLARGFVLGKVANARTVLQRSNRDRETPDPDLTDAVDRLADALSGLQRDATLDSLRGQEGDAARTYFAVFDKLITVQRDAFWFHERNRRPPLDNVNALLSFLYTLATHDVSSALEGVGLDPAVGFLHADRPGRPSLALDMVEEFRPYVADRLALTLINREQVRAKGFVQTETGGVTMDDDTRKEVLVAYQKRKQEEIRHPFLDERIPIGLLPHVQALLLARRLRGELDAYPPFLWK